MDTIQPPLGGEFCIHHTDSLDSNSSGENSSCWYQSDGLTSFDNSHSFSVVYKSYDFPFPSIHYPPQEEDLLDPQFSFDCIHGGGSMLSSLDVSLESCLDEAKASPKRILPTLMISDSKEDEIVMTPVRSIDLRTVVEAALDDDCEGRFVRGGSSHSESFDSTIKDTNPVEFRSGYRGVSWNRRMKAWLAFWSEGKNRRSKTFNAKVMGFDKARAAAIDFLKRKKQLLQQIDDNACSEMGSGSSEGLPGMDDEDYGEGGSLADSATTTSDSPNSSDILCAVCGGSQDGVFASSECCCVTGFATGSSLH